ncbi:MAG: leucine--tRNA ligase [Fidelibacterota bacterium]
MKEYNFKDIETKWQAYWDRNHTFRAIDLSEKPKYYCLVEFPYPSGDGLHVGHPRSYTALDILARKKRMEGYNVLFPMGFDSFGLPSENYAIKTGIHPSITTKDNIERFTTQLKSLGFSFDWSRTFSTTDPEYYKWTQWIFIQLFNHGLAYKDRMPINWCLSCKTGLANEEVVDGKCERCGGEVEKRQISQWMLKITEYADRLVSDLDTVNYLDKIKRQQINWVGRSEGAEVTFRVDGHADDEITVYTTRPDTLFGATFMVLSPEHPLVDKITTQDREDEVRQYRRESLRKSDLERTELNTEKTGVFTGAWAVNPVNQKSIPIWIADYVLMTYGTGGIMAVPAHDSRDFEFARKYGLNITCVIDPDPIIAEQEGISVQAVHAGEACWTMAGKAMNSANVNGLNINGLPVSEAIEQTTQWLESHGIGKKAINFKLRDWVFSRQRYWGEPIPMIHCESCGWIPVPEEDLPVLLPEVDRFEPSDTGQSPLALFDNWVEVPCPHCNKPSRRETDTMPNWAGSSWYFLRYIDPHNDQELAAADLLRYWMPVDWYNGGMEHTTLHLLYSRFWNKFLFDIGISPTSEPYRKRTSHGMVLGEGGEKMSKSRGNVINPDDVVAKHGADVFRLYEMFIGPFDQAASWDTKGIAGMDRFVKKFWRFILRATVSEKPLTQEASYIYNYTIKKVTQDIETLNMNTAISQLMICTNALSALCEIPKTVLESMIQLVSPFAPHMAEELWEIIGHDQSITYASWPICDESQLRQATIQIAVQINGKVRAQIAINSNDKKDAIITQVKKDDRVQKYISGKSILKEIYVPGKLVSLVVK